MTPMYREQWLATRPTYLDLEKEVRSRLLDIVRTLGTPADVDSRVKDMASFLKKCLLKGYADPIAQMPDKLGCRLTFLFSQHVLPVEDAVGKVFRVLKREDHGHDGEDLFGYSAIHLDLAFPDGNAALSGLRFELQLHTAGQNVWAKVTHKLAYKGIVQPDRMLLRRLNRLSALLELFDNEVQDVRDILSKDPNYKNAAMLSVLEKHYYRLTGRDFSLALSKATLKVLSPLLADIAVDELEPTFDAYILKHHEQLQRLYEDYSDDGRCSPLIFQPEIFAIFFLLERDRFRLQEEWARELPPEWLEEVGTIWGTPLPTLS